ncbi:GTP-binding protein REM 1-like [Hetaerina americana]|uniref:GTP-binding protein REM 1-like n=1 Tax=Hetaerina americana TaxID=62018 RepID=UPI003A7F427D
MEEEDLASLASASSVASVRGPGYSSRPTSPSPGSHRGSRTGLAYLASRRGSRDSQASEDLGPLAFAQSSRATRRRTSNFLELPVADHIRPRVCSLPESAFNPRGSSDESAFYRLRTFSTTNKGGVVNRGDALISRRHRSKSNTSVNSTASRHSNASGVSPGERSPFEGSCCGSSYVSSEGSVSGLGGDEEETPKYRVVLLGDSGVGKTALVSQFMTSEYMNTYDASLDDEFGEKTVSVLLDGEESEMVFIDHPSVEMSVENSLSTYAPHACVVVYSVVDRATFKAAEGTLHYLWKQNYTMEKAVILVGNKADLARARTITTSEGKSLAMSHDCKFIETSSGIQHNVDELLVGVLKQIRLRESRDRKLRKKKGNAVNGGSVNKKGRHHLYGSKTSLSLHVAREILSKMCLNDSKSKSCENLHVL